MCDLIFIYYNFYLLNFCKLIKTYKICINETIIKLLVGYYLEYLILLYIEGVTMNILIMLKQIYRRLGLNSDSFYKVKRVKQEEFLCSLKKPQTSIDKSFNQYKCQAYIMNTLFVILLNIASFFIKPIYVYLKKRKKVNGVLEYEAVFVTGGISLDTIPLSLKKNINILKK